MARFGESYGGFHGAEWCFFANKGRWVLLKNGKYIQQVLHLRNVAQKEAKRSILKFQANTIEQNLTPSN